MSERMRPIHPGRPLPGFSMSMASASTGLPGISMFPQGVSTVHGRRAITAGIALRLGRFFGMEPGFWMK